jgi:hypothetical protein
LNHYHTSPQTAQTTEIFTYKKDKKKERKKQRNKEQTQRVRMNVYIISVHTERDIDREDGICKNEEFFNYVFFFSNYLLKL